MKHWDNQIEMTVDEEEVGLRSSGMNWVDYYAKVKVGLLVPFGWKNQNCQVV